jgi:hypothetical protein
MSKGGVRVKRHAKVRRVSPDAIMAASQELML